MVSLMTARAGVRASSQLQRMLRPAPAVLTGALRVPRRGRRRPGFGGIIGGLLLTRINEKALRIVVVVIGAVLTVGLFLRAA